MKSVKTYCTLLSILATFLTFSLSSPGYAEVRGVTKDTLTIGFIGDMTGLSASQSRHVTNAARAFFGYLNEQGGINGRRVEVVYEDDRYLIPGALAAFKKLVYRDEIFALIGPSQSGGVLALMKHVDKTKTTNMLLNMGERFISPVRPYAFNIGATYEDVVSVIFDYIMQDLKPKEPRVATVYPDVEFGKIHHRMAEKAAKHYGIKLHKEIVNFGALEATSQVLNLKRNKIKYVVHFGINPLTSLVMRESRKYAYSATHLGAVAASEADAVKGALKSLPEAFYGIRTHGFWSDDTEGMAKLREVSKKFYPDTKFQNGTYIRGWTKALLLTEGMKRAGRNLDSESLVKALESISNFETGVMGPVTYSSQSHKGNDLCRVYKGNFKTDKEEEMLFPITGWRKASLKMD
ncbi:MAG: ABC transporter substrate-binding protein [Pseudomonadota bacterium]